MTGQEEARLTFLAARRWFGWSSGRLLVIDIGGGSLEVASGIDEEPDAMASLPLGAGAADPGLAQQRPAVGPGGAAHAQARAGRDRPETGGMLRQGAPDQVVGTSKTFRQLARIAGAAPSGRGPLRQAHPAARGRGDAGRGLPTMTQAERAKLPGVSASRVAQLPAGAIVADAVLELLGVDQLEQCPWALREGVILRRLDTLAQGLGTLPDCGSYRNRGVPRRRGQPQSSPPGMSRIPSSSFSVSMTAARTVDGCLAGDGADGDRSG